VNCSSVDDSEVVAEVFGDLDNIPGFVSFNTLLDNSF